MCDKALPEWYPRTARGTGTDWDVRFLRDIPKAWFAYGPRATCWFHKWRKWPKTLIAIRSRKGSFRLETEGWTRDSFEEFLFRKSKIFNRNFENRYLSRIQKYTPWSFQIQWPFLISGHIYLGQRLLLQRPLFFYFGFHRDADKTYFGPSAFIGLTFK